MLAKLGYIARKRELEFEDDSRILVKSGNIARKRELEYPSA